MATPLDFARALLNRIGLPQTRNRLVSIVAFVAREGGHWMAPQRGTHNPLNTTLSMPGAVDQSNVDPSSPRGIKRYPNWESGIEATARTMVQANMRPILNALIADADPHTFLQSINQSDWCPGCKYSYDVANVDVLYNAWANRDDHAEEHVEFLEPASGFRMGSFIAVALAAGGAWYFAFGPGRAFVSRALRRAH